MKDAGTSILGLISQIISRCLAGDGAHPRDCAAQTPSRTGSSGENGKVQRRRDSIRQTSGGAG